MVWGLALTLSFALVEAVAGWWSGSLALLSDSGHMVTDGLALGLALFAQTVARSPPSERNTFGYARAEVLGAFVNAVFMLVVVVLIAIEAVHRLLDPQPVAGVVVMIVAAVGLAINLVVARLLHGHHEHDLNTRAAYLHVLGDALGSVAALVAGAIVWQTGWVAADPLLSLFVVALMLYSTTRLLRQSIHVLMEGVPAHLSYPGIGQALAGIPGVRNVHDLHVWHMSAERVALSAHVMIDNPAQWPAVLAAVRRVLRERFAIEHVTLQPGWDDGREPGSSPTAHRVIPVAAVEHDEAPDRRRGRH
jgi:cobalt-zinc-cadmium efflux system protein